jgi:hypothetical protein
VAVTNAAYNGDVGPGNPQSFGYVGAGTSSGTTATCTTS